MKSVILNVYTPMNEEELTTLASDIIEAASNVFSSLEVELDADENENIIINVREYSDEE